MYRRSVFVRVACIVLFPPLHIHLHASISLLSVIIHSVPVFSVTSSYTSNTASAYVSIMAVFHHVSGGICASASCVLIIMSCSWEMLMDISSWGLNVRMQRTIPYGANKSKSPRNMCMFHCVNLWHCLLIKTSDHRDVHQVHSWMSPSASVWSGTQLSQLLFNRTTWKR